MIIQIRGTSGSGKSHIVRELLGLFDSTQIRPIHRTGRKQPISYRLCYSVNEPELAIIGHYETKCGGCDTISTPGQSYQIIFDLIRRNAMDGRNVLFEGLLISGDFNWTAALKDLGVSILIIELDLTVEQCLESVNARRKERMEKLGKEFTPVNPINTETKHKLIQKVCTKLAAVEGITVEKHSRESAFNRIKELLNV